MNNNELYTLVRHKIIQILTQANIDLPVIQLIQPTFEGIDGQGAVFMQMLSEETIGWPYSKTIKQSNKSFVRKFKQKINSNMRISCLYTSPLIKGVRLQAVDILRLIKMRLTARSYLEELNLKQLNLLNIKMIEIPVLLDQANRQNIIPYFDLVICREESLVDDRIDQIKDFTIKDIPI